MAQVVKEGAGWPGALRRKRQEIEKARRAEPDRPVTGTAADHRLDKQRTPANLVRKYRATP